MNEFDQGCRQKAWAVGAGAGLVVALFVMSVGHQGVMAGLFLGVITFLLLGGFLVWAFCTGSDIGLAPPKARAPVAVPAPVPVAKPVVALAEEAKPAAPVAAPVVAPAAPEASAAPAAVMSAPLAAEPAPEAPATAQKPAKAKAEKPAKPKKAEAVAEKAAAAKPAKEPKAKKPKDGKPKGLKAPRKGGADDLKLIEGIGPKLEEKLNDWGIYHFDQIATWGEAEVAYADANVPRFKGRCSRDRWVAQAKIIVDEGLERFLERAKTNDY
ncbi:MAG: endonuclease [Sphingomonadales bacterium]|nr:endonuclease [Sphingomonadales bacterium]